MVDLMKKFEPEIKYLLHHYHIKKLYADEYTASGPMLYYESPLHPENRQIIDKSRLHDMLITWKPYYYNLRNDDLNYIMLHLISAVEKGTHI